MLPNLIVIGAGKSGTSALYYYLHQHPEITMSQVKELRFFNGERWDMGLDWYESQWEGSSAPVRGEATPAYTHYPSSRGTPERMHDVIPEAKLVYMVRDPVERILSSYMNDYAQGREHREPSEALAPSPTDFRVRVSRYAFQLEQYLARFSMEQILVVTHEELLARRRATLRQVFRFLGVNDSFDTPKFDVLRNVSTEKRRMRWRSRWLPDTLQPKPGQHLFQWDVRARVKRTLYAPLSVPIERPTLTPEQRRGFVEILKPDAERLRQLTGKSFEDWSV